MLKTNRSFISDYLKGYEHLFYLPEPYHEIDKSIKDFVDKEQESDLKTFAGKLDKELPESVILFRMQIMKKLRQIYRILVFFTVIAVIGIVFSVIAQVINLLNSL